MVNSLFPVLFLFLIFNKTVMIYNHLKKQSKCFFCSVPSFISGLLSILKEVLHHLGVLKTWKDCLQDFLCQGDLSDINNLFNLLTLSSVVPFFLEFLFTLMFFGLFFSFSAIIESGRSLGYG